MCGFGFVCRDGLLLCLGVLSCVVWFGCAGFGGGLGLLVAGCFACGVLIVLYYIVLWFMSLTWLFDDLLFVCGSCFVLLLGCFWLLLSW